MSGSKVTCPNCRAVLKLAASLAPGKIVKCPKCGAAFKAAQPAPPTAPDVKAAVPKAGDGGKPSGAIFRIADEPTVPETKCPECMIMLPGDADLCTKCGYDLRAATKRRTVRASAWRRREKRDGPQDLSEILEEADQLIDEAKEALETASFLDSDTAFLKLRASSKTLNKWRSGGAGESLARRAVNMAFGGVFGRILAPGAANTRVSRRKSPAGTCCANPECREDLKDDAVNHEFHGMQITLCGACSARLIEEVNTRNSALETLKPLYKQLSKARKENPNNKEVGRTLAAVGELAGRGGIKLEGCFIATAAFGSPFDAEVETLREYRDRVLRRCAAGRYFVRLYYTIAPPLAALLARTERGRAVVRWLLGPVVAYCRRRLASPPWHEHQQRPKNVTS